MESARLFLWGDQRSEREGDQDRVWEHTEGLDALPPRVGGGEKVREAHELLDFC